MLPATKRLQPRTADVASKVMDGEAIIINLSNGVYYSLDKAGAVVWEQVTAARTVAETVSAIAARYDVVPAHAQADVERLLTELLDEDLIELFDGDTTATAETPTIRALRVAYEPPVLNIYRDMGDLLALDPPVPGLDSPWQDPEQVRS